LFSWIDVGRIAGGAVPNSLGGSEGAKKYSGNRKGSGELAKEA
jgi:hypothetical protein